MPRKHKRVGLGAPMIPQLVHAMLATLAMVWCVCLRSPVPLEHIPLLWVARFVAAARLVATPQPLVLSMLLPVSRAKQAATQTLLRLLFAYFVAWAPILQHPQLQRLTPAPNVQLACIALLWVKLCVLPVPWAPILPHQQPAPNVQLARIALRWAELCVLLVIWAPILQLPPRRLRAPNVQLARMALQQVEPCVLLVV